MNHGINRKINHGNDIGLGIKFLLYRVFIYFNRACVWEGLYEPVRHVMCLLKYDEKGRGKMKDER